MMTMNAPGQPGFLLAVLIAGMTGFGLAPTHTLAATRVGVAAVDITPPLGIPLAGYYHERGADGILDPLFSRAMVIEVEDVRVVLVSLDLISVTRAITDRTRSLVEQATGIRGDRIMISATHAHTGPELAEREEPDGRSGGRSELALVYTQALPGRITEGIRQAIERLRPAQLSVATGRCENLTYNRRYLMRDGTVGWNPGKLNPEIVMPAGPSDPAVEIFYAEAPGAEGPAEGLVTYVNFAMHPDTCGGSRISADWPGALGRVLAGYHGTNHLTLVGNGASGNLNHLDFSWRWPQGTPIEQHRIATLLGASVFQAYKHLRPLAAGPLRGRSEIVELALADVTPAQVEAAKQILQVTKDDRGENFMRQVRAHRVLEIAGRHGEPFLVEVQALALGSDLAWVSLPGEAFVELGLALKQRSPFPRTLVVELANENIGYIPDRRSYAEGNYEPESARCAPGSGERLIDAAVRLLSALRE